MSKQHDASKKAKNIAAIVYLLVMIFLVGGSYWHQQHPAAKVDSPAVAQP